MRSHAPLLALLVILAAASCARDAVPAFANLDAAATDGAPPLDLIVTDAALTDAHLPGVDARSCDSARAELKSSCGFSESWIAGLSCRKNPACVLACFALLARCEEVGCAFCETCDCAGNTPFSKCVFACP